MYICIYVCVYIYIYIYPPRTSSLPPTGSRSGRRARAITRTRGARLPTEGVVIIVILIVIIVEVVVVVVVVPRTGYF